MADHQPAIQLESVHVRLHGRPNGVQLAAIGICLASMGCAPVGEDTRVDIHAHEGLTFSIQSLLGLLRQLEPFGVGPKSVAVFHVESGPVVCLGGVPDEA